MWLLHAQQLPVDEAAWGPFLAAGLIGTAFIAYLIRQVVTERADRIRAEQREDEAHERERATLEKVLPLMAEGVPLLAQAVKALQDAHDRSLFERDR